ncbi:MAG TPA: hypothetical protein VL147_09805 [Devosia sp.]|jgi:hypothetical protein|nr:hypothetical protein [Devosia sp.]
MAERHKFETGMLVLAVFGALLFLPPLVYVFNQNVSHFGVPQIVIYLFAVWAALIAGTAALTHYMPRHRPPKPGDGSD